MPYSRYASRISALTDQVLTNTPLHAVPSICVQQNVLRPFRGAICDPAFHPIFAGAFPTTGPIFRTFLEVLEIAFPTRKSSDSPKLVPTSGPILLCGTLTLWRV